MTNDEIFNIADEYFGYSDTGYFYAKEDELLEFAEALLTKYKEALCQHG